MKIEFAKADYGLEEIEAVNRVLISEYLASGPENDAFEREFADYIGVKYAVCVNSGSSANLLALASLGLKKGSYVMTGACGFPATVNPIIHLGLNPKYIDYDTSTHNICVQDVSNELKNVSAVIVAHTLGNPIDFIDMISEAAKILNIPVIEDCCEAVGSSYKGKKLGFYGTLGTYSFYPAHQITALGGGGMVVTNDEKLYKKMKSMRDWGKMYDWDSGIGGVQTDYCSPIKYHRGYTYETIGWNFKLPEANCAFGREQLKKLDDFKKIRIINWNILYDSLKNIDQIFISPMSREASPFGFCMDIKENRNKFGYYLESNGIRHRPFFAGNILRQPAYKSPEAWSFRASDYLMEHSLFIGCHTKLTSKDLDYIIDKINAYFGRS